MKKFSEYLNEDFDPAIFNHDGGISINDPTVVDAINSNLEVATGCVCRTPYNALEEVRKVLAYYKIFLPKSVFLDQNHGHDVFEVSQFGDKMGMNNQGEVVTADNSSLFVYFEWSLNESGMYDAFACICNQEDLDEILADYESEVESDLQEEVMPDLKKKMGAKKVTLPNMMRKEENLNELRVKTKEALKAIKKRIEKKHDAEWEATYEKRKKEKLKGGEKTREQDKSRNDLAKRWLRADKAEKKLKEENINEISDESKKKYLSHATDWGNVFRRPKPASLTGLHGGAESEKGLRKSLGNKMSSGEIAASKRFENRLKDKYEKRKSIVKKVRKSLDEEQINEISADKATKAYKRAKDKLLDSDIMVSLSKGQPYEGKWKKKSEKRHKQAVKFATYANKKEYEAGKLKEDYPGVQRRSNKSLDPDLQKDFKDYKSDQQAKHSSNAVKMSWQNSPNPTFKTMGMVKPWQSTDSRAKYDATRDKVVDKQNQREIRRDPPITVKEEKKDVPWDTEKGDDKPSTPYKNKAAKAKQLARQAMKKAKTEKK